MKIKKKDLRRGEAQLPINYPQPEVEDGYVIDVEKARVDFLCRRLAHNEVAVRDAVLAELPRYIQSVTGRVATLEADVDMAAVRRLIAMRDAAKEKRNKTNSKKRSNKINIKKKDNNNSKKGNNDDDCGDGEGGEKRRVIVNVLRELEEYRDREESARRKQRRQMAIRRLREEKRDEPQLTMDNDHEENEEEEEETTALQATGRKSLRQIYGEWISVWGEIELLLLKLSRGIFFCLWHSDKPLVQLDCAKRIARLIDAPHTNTGKILLFSCLMRVLIREWRSMDRYRSDKFLALVRKMIYELLCLLKSIENETRRQLKGSGNSKITNNSEEEERDNALTSDPLCRALDEACYVFQSQIVPEPTGVGLSMHVCDVLFDELCRAALSPTLFVTLSDRIALYAMSQGNYVEKRVLDYFISPIVGGMLASHRREQYKKAQQDSKSTAAAPAKTRKRSRENNHDTSNDETDNVSMRADMETQLILLQLADCCRNYSVWRRTVRPARVMFTESEMMLRQAANPDGYNELTRVEMRRRIEHEVADLEETRRAVLEERRKMRLLRVEEKKRLMQSLKKKKRRLTLDDGEDDDEDSDEGVKVKLDKMKKKKKLQPRNTKRKKHYTLTKKDLYGNE